MAIKSPLLPLPKAYELRSHCCTYTSSLVSSETTPLLHPSSPSLLIYKENVRHTRQVSKQPVVQQGWLASPLVSEEDVSSNDWRPSDYSLPWSSKKEDLKEEDEDEDDADSDAEDDDDDSDNSDSNSDFVSSPPKRARWYVYIK